jgi:hypothetical protein
MMPTKQNACFICGIQYHTEVNEKKLRRRGDGESENLYGKYWC